MSQNFFFLPQVAGRAVAEGQKIQPFRIGPFWAVWQKLAILWHHFWTFNKLPYSLRSQGDNIFVSIEKSVNVGIDGSKNSFKVS